MNRMLDAVPWVLVPKPPAPEDPSLAALPYVTHQGVLRIAGLELRVYQLSSGDRVIDPEDFDAFLDAFER